MENSHIFKSEELLVNLHFVIAAKICLGVDRGKGAGPAIQLILDGNEETKIQFPNDQEGFKRRDELFKNFKQLWIDYNSNPMTCGEIPVIFELEGVFGRMDFLIGCKKNMSILPNGDYAPSTRLFFGGCGNTQIIYDDSTAGKEARDIEFKALRDQWTEYLNSPEITDDNSKNKEDNSPG